MLVWLMAAILLASCLAFAGLLLQASRAARPHAAAWRDIQRELAERLAMPLDAARGIAEDVVATQGVSEAWAVDLPEADTTRLATLNRDVGLLLKRHKRLVFRASGVTFGAEYMLGGAGRVPAGTSQIGVDEDGAIICAYDDGRPDVVSLFLSDAGDEQSFPSIHHCIAVLADADLGKRATVL